MNTGNKRTHTNNYHGGLFLSTLNGLLLLHSFSVSAGPCFWSIRGESEPSACCLTSCRWGGDGPAAAGGGGIGPADGGGGIGPADGGGGIGPTDGGGSGGPADGDGGLAGGGGTPPGGASAFADDGKLDGEPRFSKAWSFIKIFCSEFKSGSCCLTSCRWGGDGPAAGAGGGGGIGPTDGGGIWWPSWW